MKNEVDTTTENNKLIAEFMQLRLTTDGIQPLYYDASNGLKALPKYHSDWNYLMEVVEKVESLGHRVIMGFSGSKNYCEIGLNNFFIQIFEETKIETVYNAVIEFIKWYNAAKEN